MRQILGIGLILTFAGIALAQDSVPPGGPALPEWNVLYGRKEFANAQNMFSSYIRKLVQKEQQRRSKAIADFSSAEEIRGTSGKRGAGCAPPWAIFPRGLR